MEPRSPFQRYPDRIQVNRARPVACAVRVPGSKSLTNRYLLLAAMAEGESFLRFPLESEDTGFMKKALAQAGIAIREVDDGWRVSGRTTWLSPPEPVFVGNAGTVMRFMVPALALGDFSCTVTGNGRMRRRPIRDLTDGMAQLGVDVAFPAREGYPPVVFKGPMKPGAVRLRGDASSQYLSGLLMALPRLGGASRIVIQGPLVSRTYVAMTLDCMRRFGVDVEAEDTFRRFKIPGSARYRGTSLSVEPDASTASYWFALAAMVGGMVTVRDVPPQSHQGDFGFLGLLERMGAAVRRRGDDIEVSAERLTGIDVDMNTMSDVAPTLAVLATRAQSATTIRNVGNMRIKECDRIATLQRAFDALGLNMESGSDWLKVHPGVPTRAALVDPEEDHRMAMCFALLGLAYGGVGIKDPGCVGKTYPRFFEEMDAVLVAHPSAS